MITRDKNKSDLVIKGRTSTRLKSILNVMVEDHSCGCLFLIVLHANYFPFIYYYDDDDCIHYNTNN